MDSNEKLKIGVEIFLRVCAHHGQLCAQGVVYLTFVIAMKIQVGLLLKIAQECHELLSLFLAGFLQLLLYLRRRPDTRSLNRIYIDIDTINRHFFELHVLGYTRFSRVVGLIGMDMLGMRDIRAERLVGDVVTGYKDVTLSHNGRVKSLDGLVMPVRLEGL